MYQILVKIKLLINKALTTAGVQLVLDSQEIVTIWQTTRLLHSALGRQYKRSAFELRLAYATTVHQAEGLTLPEVCIVFEKFAPPGWGYTALTRAVSRTCLRAIGAPTREHFKPRDGASV